MHRYDSLLYLPSSAFFSPSTLSSMIRIILFIVLTFMASLYGDDWGFFVWSRFRYTCRVFVIDKLWLFYSNSSKFRALSYMHSIVSRYLLFNRQIFTRKKYPAKIGRTWPSTLLEAENCYSNIKLKYFIFDFTSSLKKLFITDIASDYIISMAKVGSLNFLSSESLSFGGVDM